MQSEFKLTKVKSANGKSFTWYITGTYRGERVRKSTRTSERNEAERQLAAEIKRIDDALAQSDSSDCTFAEACIHYMKQGGEARFLPPLIEEFGEMRISEMRAGMLTAYAEREKPDAKLSYVSRIIHEPINAVVNCAADAEMCAYKRFPKPKFKHERRPPAPEEWIGRTILHASDRLAALMLFALTTGARAGEACAVLPEDIDWDKRRITIRDTKTDQLRRVVINPMFAPALEKLLPLRPGKPIFGLADERAVNKAVKRLCERKKWTRTEFDPKLGEDVQVVDYYSSHQWGRKAFATFHLRRGKSTKWVASAGGWKTITMVDRHYGHMEQSYIDDGMMDVSDEISIHIDKKLTNSAERKNESDKEAP